MIQNSDVVVGSLYMRAQKIIKEAQVLFFAPPMIPGYSASTDIEVNMQDKTGGDLNKFFDVVNDYTAALEARPEINSAKTTFNPNFPQYMIDIDAAACKKAGISPSDILTTMQGYYGGLYASNFNRFGKMYRVMIQSDPLSRKNLESLKNIKVRNSAGEMAPISQFITVDKVYGPDIISRFNLYTSMKVMVAPASGYTSGQALTALAEVAGQNLPAGYTYELGGMAREEAQSSGSATGLIFILCFVFVYLLLSAQYESYILPLAVLLSVPFGLLGSFLFVNGVSAIGNISMLKMILGTMSNNIYMQIALIMLMGLLAKNAILIVEFALDRRKMGMSITWAAVLGAGARLRPILMTSLAMVVGLLPLMFAFGVGAHGNRTLGTASIGGMLIGMICQIFIVPVLFVIFQYLQEKVKPMEWEDIDNTDAVTEIEQFDMKKQILYMVCATALLSSCHIYKSYDRPEDITTSGLYRDPIAENDTLVSDTTNFGNLPWREVFTDPQLQSLIEAGLKQNTDLLTAAQNVKAAEASLLSARLAYAPSLGLSPQGTISSFDKNAATKTYSLPVTASWQVDLFGQLLNSKRNAQVTLKQTKAYRQAVQTQVISNIANMYYTLMMLDRQLEITKSTAEILKKNAETMEAMKDAAMYNINSTGVEQSKAAYAQVLASIPDIEQSIRETENALSTFLGEAPHAIKRGTLEAQVLPTELSAGVPIQLLSNRPDVKAAEMALASCYYNTNSARAAFYPQITLSGSAGWTNSAGSAIINPGKLLASAVGSLTQPLFYRGQNIARLKAAKAQEESAKLSFQQALLNAGSEVSNALSLYQKTSEKVESRRLQVESAKKASEDTKELFNLGTSTYLEVLSAQQSYLSAQISQVSDCFDQMQAVVSLYQALGGGREE